MAPSISTPSIVVEYSPLTQSTFAPFGTVIENPLPNFENSMPPNLPNSSPNVVRANQNTALKFSDVTFLLNRYSQSPTGPLGTAVMNMFCCFPRELSIGSVNTPPVFNVRILERHPYTTQTFMPMNLSSTDPETKYLVIVAPTLPPTEAFPDLGPPDLRNLCAFIASGNQAVTYGAGTWHAPMVVVGKSRVDFIVLQFANGVAEDDCQESELEENKVVVPFIGGLGIDKRRSKL